MSISWFTGNRWRMVKAGLAGLVLVLLVWTLWGAMFTAHMGGWVLALLAGYGVYALVLLKGNWPVVEDEDDGECVPGPEKRDMALAIVHGVLSAIAAALTLVLALPYLVWVVIVAALLLGWQVRPEQLMADFTSPLFMAEMGLAVALIVLKWILTIIITYMLPLEMDDGPAWLWYVLDSGLWMYPIMALALGDVLSWRAIVFILFIEALFILCDAWLSLSARLVRGAGRLAGRFISREMVVPAP